MKRKLPLLLLVLCTGCQINRGADKDPEQSEDGITIAAKPTLVTDDNVRQSWKITGTILRDGTPVTATKVWAITTLQDEPDGTQDYKSGTIEGNSFEILNVPHTLVSLKTGKPANNILITLHAQVGGELAVKQLDGNKEYQQGDAPVIAAVVLFAIIFLFVANIGIGLLYRPSGYTNLRWKYGLSVGITLLFAIVMVASFTVALYQFRPDPDTEQRVSYQFGFATIYDGKYSEHLPSGLIFSLTGPPESENEDLGFAAPVWVLLLSVIGSTLITIRVVINEIEKPPHIERVEHVEDIHRSDLRRRIKIFVEHQTFLLASPFVGIFVYLSVVQMVGKETQVLAVAVAALGAGPALNYLLNKAIAASTRALSSSGDAPERSARSGASGEGSGN